MNRLSVGVAFCTSLMVTGAAFAHAGAHSVTVTVHAVSEQGIGESIGTLELQDSPQGLKITPRLKGLTPGGHGFHIHENPDCGPKEKDGKMVAALAAGGHFDPKSTGKHMGPHGHDHGHRGDLPELTVAADGTASTGVVVVGLSLDEIRNRSIMIHAGGDNYADSPAPLGGGGARVACGVIPK